MRQLSIQKWQGRANVRRRSDLLGDFGLKPLFTNRAVRSGQCYIIAVPGAPHSIIVTPVKSFVEIPVRVELGDLKPAILNWLQINSAQGPLLIILSDLKSDTLERHADEGKLSIFPHLKDAPIERLSDTSVVSDVAPAIISLLATEVSPEKSTRKWADILALAKQLNFGAITCDETSGHLISTNRPEFVFRAIVDHREMPFVIFVVHDDGMNIAVPINVKLTPADEKGRRLAEFRARVHYEELVPPAIRKIESLVMLKVSTVTRVRIN